MILQDGSVVTASGFFVQRFYSIGIIDRSVDQQKIQSGWWFQTFFIFTPIWGRFPI